MKFFHASLAALLLAVASTAPVFAADTAKPIAKVNGVAIPSSYGDALVTEQTSQGAPDNAQLHDAVRDELVRREVLIQEAHKQGFDKKPAVQVRQEIARQGIVIGMYLDDWVRNHPVSDAAVRAEYDRQVKETGSREYKIRHIQTKTEQEAQEIIKKLNAGANFEELAKQSTDEGTRDHGGDLGWGPLNGSPFEDAVSKLDKGQFTQTPVKSQYGYHVVLMEDSRKFEPPKFEDVKDHLKQSMQQKAVTDYINSLMQKAKIE